MSTLCWYDLRKDDLFVLSWARVRRASISSELLMCGGGVRCIRCIGPIFYGCCSDSVEVWECLLCMRRC